MQTCDTCRRTSQFLFCPKETGKYSAFEGQICNKDSQPCAKYFLVPYCERIEQWPLSMRRLSRLRLASITAAVYKCGLKRPRDRIKMAKYFAFEDPVCNKLS